MTYYPEIKHASFASERLFYRGIQEEDSEDIVRWRSDEENYRFFSRPVPLGMEEHLDWFKRYLFDGARYEYLITVKHSGRKIGTAGLKLTLEHTGEISYMIGEKDQRRSGYGTEAILAISRFSFSHFDIKTLRAEVRAGNPASQRAAENAGFTPEFIVYMLDRDKV